MTVVAVTGATGFVGRHLRARLIADGHHVIPIVRQPAGLTNERVCADIADADAVEGLLGGVDVVIHCAARVHVMDDRASDPLAAFRRVNVTGTANLAHAAARSGVRRFVLLSSIKVNGETTDGRRAFAADDDSAPLDAYGVSKAEAERTLVEIAAGRFEPVIVRSPLVYGPGVGGNMRTMVDWVARGRPLPLGRATRNRRSLLSVANLVDLLAVTTTHPAAAGRTFLASDGDDVSTARLLREIGVAVGRRARLFPVPLALLRASLAIAGKAAIADRLLGDLSIDSAPTRVTLGWKPPQTLNDGLRAVVTAP